MATRMQQRRGTAQQWIDAAPVVLAPGEIGFETDSNQFKIGDGTTEWQALSYFKNLESLGGSLDDYIELTEKGIAGGVATLDVNGVIPLAQLPGAAALDAEVTSAVSAATSALESSVQALDEKVDDNHGTALATIESSISVAIAAEVTRADNSYDAFGSAANAQTAGEAAAITARDAAKAYADSEILGAISTEEAARNLAIDAAVDAEVVLRDAAIEAAVDAEVVLRDAAIASQSTSDRGYTDTAISTLNTSVSGALDAHALDSTNVHGIADTAALATKSYADAIGTTATDALALKAPLSSPTFTGTVVLPTVTAGGNIVPTTDNTFDLGSPTNMWKDIYVGPGSLYVNGQKVLQDESGAIVVSADINENLGLRTSGSGNIELDPTGTGSVNIKGPLVVEAGANFSSADGNGIAFSNGLKSNSLESNSLNTDLSLSGNGTGKVYLNDNAEVNGNLVVGGNLTVSGTTTTVNSETISLADNIIDLNSNFTTGSPTENAGLRVMRGDSNAVQVRWNESTDKWEFTTDGTNFSVIAATDSPTFTGTVTIPAGASISGYAPTANPTFTGTVTVAANGVAFTDGTQTKAGVPSVTTIATALAAGARTIAAGEQDKFVPLAGEVVITLPATGYSTGQSIDFYQESSTGARFESTNGVVGTPGLKFRTTNSVATALKTAAGWLVFGDLSA
jgi:hypothetical protein